jgi:general stress protein YciG
VRFRRKSRPSAPAEENVEGADESVEPREGPFDADDIPEDGVQRIDLGSLLVAPSKGKDLRVQVDQKSGNVRSVVLAGGQGALELRAYAAPRGGDLWEEIRPQIAADASRKGGTATEREGRFGTELVCELKVQTADGRTGTQLSRVIGINGPRWLLRATLLGEPAKAPEDAEEWEEAITRVAVRRGGQAMPVGEQLPLELPEGMTPAAGDQPGTTAS